MFYARFYFKFAALVFATLHGPLVLAQSDSLAKQIDRGRYLVLIGHCNNCHTAGYAPSGGKVPEERWLTGNPVGWRGKNGTTYAHNLRLYVKDLTEDGWLQLVKNVQSRAPMPSWSLRATTDDDLKAMFHYIRSLKPLGEPAPLFLPPDKDPPRPFNLLPDMS